MSVYLIDCVVESDVELQSHASHKTDRSGAVGDIVVSPLWVAGRRRGGWNGAGLGDGSGGCCLLGKALMQRCSCGKIAVSITPCSIQSFTPLTGMRWQYN